MRKIMAVGLALLMTGCFTTRTGGGAASVGNERTDRQWFTAAGLIPLSESVGSECVNGLAYSESTSSPLDIMVSVGIFLAGTMFAGIVCSQLSSANASPCTFFSVVAPPLLIGSRTVTYACSAGAGAGPQRPSPFGAPAQGAPVQPGPPPPTDIVVPPPPPLPVP